jgi:hypothetical protein
VSKWERVGTPRDLAEQWRAMFGDLADVVPPPVVHRHKRLEALLGREPVGPDQENLEDLRWHLSVRGPDRVPTWPELVDAAHSIRPGVVFCVPMPPRDWWINVHPHVLHVWEIRDTNLIEQWRSERGLATEPT